MATHESQVRLRVRAYIEENVLYMRPGFVLADDDRLLDRGVLDSLGIVEMLSFLEDEFGVRTSDDEISESNLGSVSAIARFVVAKHGAAAA